MVRPQDVLLLALAVWTLCIMADVTARAQDAEAEAPADVDLELDDDELDALLDLDLTELQQLRTVPSPFASSFSAQDVTGADRQLAASSSGANVVSGAEATTRNTTDVGSLLGRSVSNPGVYTQQRSPVITDIRIRGYRFGQYLARADGASWVPARLDIDSILSKIDSKMIEDVVVINGPYSSRYGPAFSFVDVVTRSTPRYEFGPGWEGSTSLNYNGNGQQWNGSQYLQTGGESWGASIYYGHLTGSDYLAGNGTRVPSSYNSRNLNAGIGVDLTELTSIEFRYLRQDQTDVEVAGQFTDIDFLSTDGFTLNFRSEDRSWVDIVSIDGWYNQTRAAGSGGRPSKQALFNSVFDLPPPRSASLTLPRDSATRFDVSSTGFSSAFSWGDVDVMQATAGADLRHYQQGLSETQSRPAGGGFQTGTDDVFALVPDATSTNPGLFGEVVVAANDRLKIRTGARVDWVSVQADPGAIVRRGGPRTLDVLGPDRDESFTLWSAYISGDYEIDDSFSANLAFGLAQRPPTLTELYAMRPFESVLQQGLNRIQGYPFLDPERLKQFDIGLKKRNRYFPRRYSRVLLMDR